MVKTQAFGTVLVLDGAIQCTDRDEFSYQVGAALNIRFFRSILCSRAAVRSRAAGAARAGGAAAQAQSSDFQRLERTACSRCNPPASTSPSTMPTCCLRR